MKLYFAPGACSLSPHIVLREAGHNFELEQVNNAEKKTKSGKDYWTINAKGQVIGNTGICGVGGGPPFLFENGGPMVDLNTLVRLPSSGLTVGDVAFINNRGEIAAKGRLPNGIRHDLLLIPCDLAHSENKGCEDNAEEDDVTTHDSLAPASPSVGDEIDKLAFNIAMGRDWAGIHYRSDGVAGLRLGEDMGISILQDRRKRRALRTTTHRTRQTVRRI